MSTSKLTDQQVVERLAAKDGWIVERMGVSWHWMKGALTTGRTPPQFYLHDHAALQRVMRLLTPEERLRLIDRLELAYYPADDPHILWAAELPTSDLARLVAESLTEPCQP